VNPFASTLHSIGYRYHELINRAVQREIREICYESPTVTTVLMVCLTLPRPPKPVRVQTAPSTNMQENVDLSVIMDNRLSSQRGSSVLQPGEMGMWFARIQLLGLIHCVQNLHSITMLHTKCAQALEQKSSKCECQRMVSAVVAKMLVLPSYLRFRRYLSSFSLSHRYVVSNHTD
jgi:hypothetical protein